MGIPLSAAELRKKAHNSTKQLFYQDIIINQDTG